jgi:N-acetylmuramoyl-L-alanine amidase
VSGFHEVKAHNGDGVFSLLRRYKLKPTDCHLKQFYSLNKMEEGSALYSGQDYKLPVKILQYDGQSIRSTIGENNWDKALRIKEYNEELLSSGIRKTHYAKSNLLWVPFEEIGCAVGKAPPEVAEESNKKEEKSASKKSSNHIFGPEYAAYKVEDYSLANKVFYIISGHGGPDPGAMCKDCTSLLCEDEYAYDVALRLARNLLQHGAKVELVIQDQNDGIRDDRILKCDQDERTITGERLPYNHLKRLQQRTNYINESYKKYRAKGIKEQVVVSVHVDSNSESHEQDVFFCYYSKSNSSKRLAKTIRETFDDKYKMHQKNRGYDGHLDARNFYVLRNTLPPAVLIELANIRNSFDHRRILLNDNRQALANWIFEGLVRYAKREKSDQVIASS